jgi:hypothetical protein
MVTSFYVGEQPSDPLVVTVNDASGNALDLSDVSVVEFVGDPLPAGDAAISSPTQGKVQYSFEAPFTEAGTLTLQVKMTDEVAGVDYSAPFTITVADPTEVAELLVTPTQVEDWTGQSVSTSNVARAQADVGLACARDLAEVGWLAELSSADYYWLTLAVAYQAAAVAAQDEGLGALYVPGASSVANGDIRITYRDTSAGSGGTEPSGVTGQAGVAVSRLSWMRPFRSIQAQPFSQRGEQPDLWRPMSISGGWPR